jgi:CxxC motif-containing protein (DUF1111 family)
MRYLTAKNIFGVAVLAAAIAAGCGNGRDADQPPTHVESGGETTVFDRTSNAFTLPPNNLTDEELDLHTRGDAAFEQQFVTAPANVGAGLGPVFNNNSCNSCHIRNGRGMPRIRHSALRSQLLIRVSLPEDQGEPAVPGGSVPVPGLGLQIQDHAVFGVEPEAMPSITWETVSGEFGDGKAYELRKPVVRVELPDGSELPDDVMTSLRQPPPVFGLGLLEAVPIETLEALADANDADGDGISGRINRVWSPVEQATVPGRFGLKANQHDLLEQTAAAYADDMGVSNPIFPDADGNEDIGTNTVGESEFYAQSLGVPARRNVNDPEVIRGQKLFDQLDCASCHVTTLSSGPSEIQAVANQTFHPYTDMLLHDMGPGLADGRPDFEASGSEWRTPPLWGIGLTHTVLPGAAYLHDGRARTLEEAILWHGGEAEASKEAYRTMPEKERDALIAFLRSL